MGGAEGQSLITECHRPDMGERLQRRQPRQRALPDSDGVLDLQVLVRDNNVEQALRVLKKKLQREGVFREMKQRRAYEKPSERKTREHAEAVRRTKKAARKLAQREGLIPAPKKKVRETGRRPPPLRRPPSRREPRQGAVRALRIDLQDRS